MKTKTSLSIVVLYIFQLLICTTLNAQDLSEWVSYSQKLSVKNYQGLNFRFQASVKTLIDDDSSSARLWLRTDNGKRMGFFDNMENQPIRNGEWGSYKIKGKIDSGMQNIAFGVFCTYNGKFYFDNFTIDVEPQKDKWQNIFTANFENGKQEFVQGIQLKDQGLSQFFTASVKKDNKENVLVIEGKNVPNYGINNKAGKYANINGIKLYYEIYGQGHPLIILHGNGGSIKDATPFYPDLIKKYKVIAIDSRSQGRSGDSTAPLNYEQMADDVNTLLNQLKMDSVFIWGHSDGAIMGLLLARDHPEKVKKLLAFGANMQPDTLAIFPWAIDYMKKKVIGLNNTKLNILMLTQPNIPYSNLSQISAPILIMAGDRDMIRPEHTLKLFQCLPNSQLCIVPGSTHFAAWEKKNLFLEILNDFFNQPFKMPNTKNKFRD